MAWTTATVAVAYRRSCQLNSRIYFLILQELIHIISIHFFKKYRILEMKAIF